MIFRVLILLTCAVNLGCSVTVELYSRQNYSGLLKKVIVEKFDQRSCIQLDQTYEVRSVKTEQCIIAYETMDCKRINTKLPEGSKLYSVRVERDTPLFDIDGAYSNRQDERGVQSFRLCGTESGAGLLKVDIYNGTYYTGDLVASYEGVSRCKNIPSYIVLKGKPFSIDNHGKNMYFYDKEDCNGQDRFIPAGDNERSRSVFNLDTRAVVIRSFRPADGLPFPNLDALVYKFTFSKDGRFTSRVKQTTTHTLTNTERTTVTEYINVNISVSAEYSVAKAFTYIDTTRVKAGFLVDTRDIILENLGSTLRSSFEAHYQYPNTDQNAPTIVIKWLEGRLYQMPVDKPACTTCTLDIIVDKMQGYYIGYTAEAVVTGMAGDDKVPAEQIPYFLPPGMKYIKKHDEYSVEVTVEGEMEGSRDTYYTETDMSCMTLPNCVSNLREDL